MPAKTIVGEMSCCRDNHGKIHIEIQCSSSGVHFVDILLEAEQFAMLVTGAHISDIPLKVNGLDRVGKTKIRESRQVLLPLETYSRDEQEKWLVDNCQEEGWILNPYLRSQSSQVRIDGTNYLNYSVYKYIDTED